MSASISFPVAGEPPLQITVHRGDPASTATLIVLSMLDDRTMRFAHRPSAKL